jgi:hypothetical protein
MVRTLPRDRIPGCGDVVHTVWAVRRARNLHELTAIRTDELLEQRESYRECRQTISDPQQEV